MGIELPPELADIAAVTGVAWPEADEDALRAQAAAWRHAARDLTTLAGDADALAQRALAAMSGPAEEAARRMWSGFVHSDTGSLTILARGADEAADRLEHAAEQVGQAKVEIVRRLVDAARNRDAAVTAAEAGHPTALAGLDTAWRATAADLGAVTEGLVSAVGPGSGAAASTRAPEDVSVEVPEETPEETHEEVSEKVSEEVPVDLAAVARALAPEPPPGALDDTGPIALGPVSVPLAQAPTPPTGLHVPLAGAPTPPTGTPQAQPVNPARTQLAGFTGGPVVAPVPGQFAQPPMGQPFAPQQFGGQHFGGQQFGGQPFAGQHFGGQAFGPGAGSYGSARPGPAGAVPPVPAVRPPHAAPPSPQAPPSVPHRPPEPSRPGQPDAPVPVGAPRQERDSVVALFLVHMFPIGHLPVASDRPARQLPVPTCEKDYAPGLRFPPHDHPRSDVIDADRALVSLGAGRRQPAPPPAEVLPCPPAALFEGYDLLGGMEEREWDRRYLVTAQPRPEYAWPLGERFPEGGDEPGEPVLLPEGMLLDRFGTALGRVFAPDGVTFARRCLPPAHREAGYRRYRVLREVPVWQAASAPWFGQPGGAVRYRSLYSAAELVTLGYLADITFEERA